MLKLTLEDVITPIFPFKNHNFQLDTAFCNFV